MPVILVISLLITVSCSHKFNSDELDLGFYQWNLWDDTEAVNTELTGDSVHPPSCGWEVLHRGNGKLLRIPAIIEDNFPDSEQPSVFWYHCRFTLPEQWEARDIVLKFEGAGPGVEVYLNEALMGVHTGIGAPFEIDVTQKIYYTLDNHLAIRINGIQDTPGPGQAGISGTIVVKSKVPAGDNQSL